MRLLRALLVLLPLVLMISTVRAEEGRRVILVLDASGSMWGQIEGKSKMQIAKEVVGKIVGKWNENDELGLVAYGHRKKGACDDIEVLTEPGMLDKNAFMAKVDGLNPKGKTPMTQAVRQAAEALKYTERQATVILVSDGIETCDPNPCAVAEELERLGVGLTIHTVGFGLDDKGAVEQLQCLAEKTGGISVLAKDANELEAALTRTVDATPAPPPEPAAPEFNVTGTVSMAEGVPLPPGFNSAGWGFAVAVNGAMGDGMGTEYGETVKTRIEAPGEYMVRVSNDVAVLDVPFAVKAGEPVALDLSFEAGLVHFSAMMDETTPLKDDGAFWELLDTEGKVVGYKYGSAVDFFAGAGNYKIRVSLGSAKAEADVSFTAGKTEDKVVMLGAGIVEVSGVFTPGGSAVLDGASISLLKAEAALDGSHESVAFTYGSKTQFNVPAGKYQAVVSLGYAKGMADVEVKAGGKSPVEVSINGGFLAVTSAAGSSVDIYSAEKDISGQRKLIGTENYTGGVNAAITAGSYHLVVTGQDGVMVGEKDFDVKAGQRTEGTIP